MYVTDIRIYGPLSAESAPFHQIGTLAYNLTDVAAIVQHARDYIVHDAKIDEESMDVVSGMLRGALALMRDLGECMGAVEELARAWEIAAPAVEVQQAA